MSPYRYDDFQCGDNNNDNVVFSHKVYSYTETQMWHKSIPIDLNRTGSCTVNDLPTNQKHVKVGYQLET